MNIYRKLRKAGITILLINLLFVDLYGIFVPAVAAQVVENSGNNALTDEVAELKTASEAATQPSQSITEELNKVEKSEEDKVEKATLPIGNFETAVSSAFIVTQPIVRKLSKSTFRANERLRLKVDNAKGVKVDVRVLNPEGETASVSLYEEIIDRSKNFTIIPPSSLQPGTYTLEVTDSTGQKSTQDFTWGVLSINPDKSVYSPKELATFAMAVLDAEGSMVCDASVTLQIKQPNGKTDLLSTDDGSIKVNPECYSKDLTLTPDYEASYTVSSEGKYEMVLAAKTPSGIYSITDFFEVSEDVPFEIGRQAATRIYPPLRYPVEITVTAHEDFEGVITEEVPSRFEITKPSEGAAYDSVVTAPQAQVLAEEVLGASVELAMPFSGKHPVTSGFGENLDDPTLQAQYEKYHLDGHDGIDFDMREGTSVNAVDEGLVVLAQENFDYGTTVVIDHSWGRTYYGHLSDFFVKKGDRVKKGQKIALSGSTGLSTAPHLHFGIKPIDHNPTNGYYGKVDPAPYLGLSERDKSVLGMTTVAEQVKVISWNVKLKKGEKVTLGYSYNAPLISPQFYSTGPLKFTDTNREIVYQEGRRWQIAADDIDAEEVNPSADNGAQGWLCTAGTDGNCTTGHYTVLDDGSATPSTSGFISTGTSGSGGETDIWDMTTFTPPSGTLNSVTNVTVQLYTQATVSSTADTVSVSVFMGGSFQTDVAITPPTNTSGWAWRSASFNGTWNQSDLDNLLIRVIRNVQGSGNPSSRDDNVQIAAAYATVTYDYTPPPTFPEITQEGYVFENDDEDQVGGDAVDGNSAQAGSAFTTGKTLTNVKKGERVTLRTHLKNTGEGAVSASDKIALFYDRNDGIWSKVSTDNQAVTSGGNCDTLGGSDAWNCTLVQANSGSSEAMGHFSSTAIDKSGTPWISSYDNTDGDLWVSQYVGSGGNCDTFGGSDAWNCTLVQANSGSSEGVGYFASIAIDSMGNPWISHQDLTDGDLWVSQYVGSGGNCDTFGGSDAWNCTLVQANSGGSEEVGDYSSIAFNLAGTAWVSHHDNTDGDLWVSQYVGSGGNCDTFGGSDAWNCTLVQANSGGSEQIGSFSELAFDFSGNPWIGYYDGTDKDLWVSQYVGSGGNCDTFGGSDAWNCTLVQANSSTTDGAGYFPSIAFDPSGAPWVSHSDLASDFSDSNLWVSQYVGSGGNCDTLGGSDAWNCTLVQANSGSSELNGVTSSIAFDPSGNPWIGNQDVTDGDLWVSQYVGSGGNCDTLGGSDAWNCTLVQANSGSSESVGEYTSLAFNPWGNAVISYRDGTDGDLWFAQLPRGGEILASAGMAGANGDAIQASHADMTSSSDSTGKGDADCVSATTWNNGKWFEAEDASGVSLPAGDVTSQCTEIAWVIDTSNAVAGTTYRFVIATDDGWRADKGKWRGPIAVSSNAYPTLTIESSSASPYVHYSKDAIAKFTSCNSSPQTGSAEWGCVVVDDHGSSALGFYGAIAIDPAGNPWVSYKNDGLLSLNVAQYVGSGGNCDTSPNIGSDAWNCTVVDDASETLAESTSIAFDPSGTPWVSYQDATNFRLKVARYVGTGGTGCGTGSTAWTCTVVDDHASDELGWYSSIKFDPSGTPWVSYQDNTNFRLKVARYVGTGGTGCGTGSTAWTCTVVDDHASENYGDYSSMVIGTDGSVWVTYIDFSSARLKVARYVGTGGTGCGTGSTAWTCSVVDDHASDALGEYTGMAIDSNNVPWISYWDTTNERLKVATYVGSGGNCDTAPQTGSDAWNCTVVDDHATVSVGEYTSIAIDPAGNPWVSYYDRDNNRLKVANRVGSGGNCDTAPQTGSDAWNCTVVDDHASDGLGWTTSIAFDHSGIPWVSYWDSTNLRLKVAKLHMPVYENGLRYLLDSGKAPAGDADGTCNSSTDNKGYCGVLTDTDLNYDSVASLSNQRPMYHFASRFSSNTTAPTITWKGRSSVAPSSSSTTGDLVLQVYRFGTTNAWEDLASDTASSDCNTTDCTLTGTPAGTASEYFEADGSHYWVYVRVWQYENSSSETLKTGFIQIGDEEVEAPELSQLLRHGKWFNTNGELQPFTF